MRMCFSRVRSSRDGELPTVKAVTARIGGASPNAVLKAIAAWNKERTKAATTQLTLDPVIANMIAEHMVTELQSMESRAPEAEENVQSLAANGRDLKHEVRRLQTELDDSRSQAQQLTGQRAERMREIVVLREDSQRAVQESETRAATERRLAEALRQELVHARIRAEAQPKAAQARSKA